MVVCYPVYRHGTIVKNKGTSVGKIKISLSELRGLTNRSCKKGEKQCFGSLSIKRIIEKKINDFYLL